MLNTNKMPLVAYFFLFTYISLFFFLTVFCQLLFAVASSSYLGMVYVLASFERARLYVARAQSNENAHAIQTLKKMNSYLLSFSRAQKNKKVRSQNDAYAIQQQPSVYTVNARRSSPMKPKRERNTLRYYYCSFKVRIILYAFAGCCCVLFFFSCTLYIFYFINYASSYNYR